MTDDSTEISNKDLLEKLLIAIKEEGNRTKEEIKNEIRVENQKLLKKIEEQSTKIKSLENKCDILEEKNKILERIVKKNNIIIFGLQLPDTNLLSYIINKFSELLGEDVTESDINNIFTIKANHGIKVEFVSYLKKVSILKSCPKLKGTGIFIVEDLCYQDRQDRKILTEHLKLARSGKQFAKIIGNKLRVNDDLYTVEQLKSMNCLETANKEGSQNIINERQSNSAPASPLVGQSTPSVIQLKQFNGHQKKIGEKEDKSGPNIHSVNETEKKRKLVESPEKAKEAKTKKTVTSNEIRSSSRNRHLSK